MYQKFFGLAEAPFNLTPDTRFLFLSRQYREALANLISGIQERKCFITLTGEIGAGKTTLCRALTNELNPETTKSAAIFNSFLNEIELLQTINKEFGLPAESDSKGDLIHDLNEFLIRENSIGHIVVLIIDEAQNLSPPVLEQICMLGNLETDKLIQIILTGQPELLDILAKPELKQLNQLISVRHRLLPLEKEEVPLYIRHRLLVAKGQIDIEFTPRTLQVIYEYSGGIPRKINILCDRCLLSAYSKVSYTIDEEIVKGAIKEIEGEKRKKAENPIQASEKTPIKTGNLVLVLIIMGFVVTGGIILGIHFANKEFAGSLDSGTSFSGSKPGMPSYLQKSDFSSTKPLAIGSADISPTPAPKPPAKPRKIYLYNWQYDEDRICRVNNPAYSYPASIITWLRLWNIEADLEEFKKAGDSSIKGMDVAMRGKFGLRKWAAENNLDKAIKYDLPFVLVFSVPPEKTSPFVVLMRAEGFSLTIADPVWGIRTIGKDQLANRIRECHFFYSDPLGFYNILKGEETSRVKALQEYLKKKAYFHGDSTGIFDIKTENAVRNFQRYHKIQPTGLLDDETVLIISTRMSAKRPRLYSSGGED
jgi:general secretion pathway protein A